jgi:TATA-binding protein-associated factor
VSVLAPCVTSADDRRQLAGIAPTVAAYALDSPLAVIREAAASATAALLRSCGGHDATRDESSFAAMGPLLLAAVRDVCNDDRRHAAVVLLARCVAALGISGLCKHLPSLFPAALAAVNDPVHATRRLAAQVFSTVVQLAPLAPADDLRALRAHDTQGSESQRGVLAHLVLGLPLPPQFGARELAACLQPGVTLRPYQTEGVGWLLFLLRAGLHGALCDEMGLGKTLQVLAAVSLHWATDGDGDAGSSRSETSSACQSSAASSRHRRPRHCLVVCPATLVRHWTAEAATFLHPRTLGHRGSRAVALEGSKAQRAKLLTSLLAKQLNADARPGTSSRSSRMRPPKNGSDTGSDSGSGDSESGGSSFGGGFMVVASYDCLRTDGALLAQVPWDVLVLDEAHTAAHASGSSRLFQAARHLRARHRLALTGTPVQNGAGDLWALFDFLMPGFLGTRAEFRRRYGGGAHGGGSTAASYGPGGRHGALAPEQILALEDLHRRVMPFLLRREKAGVLRDLPPKVFVDVPCPLSALQATLYRNVCAAAAAAAAGGSAAGIAQAEEDELDRNDEDDRDNAESMAENASASGGAGGSVGDPLGFGRRRGQRDWPQAWRGVRALRTLSLLCSHPCLAVKTATDAAAGSSSRGQALRGSGGGETQATVSHPRYDEWRTDDAASSKFQALKALLEQLGFCAGVRPTSQGQSALSKRRRRGHCTAAVGEGIEGMEDKDAEDDDKEGGASRDGGNVEGEEEDEEEEEEEEEEGEVRNVSPPQKFILFAQNRSTLDLVQECVFSRFFPSAALLRIDGQVPAAQRVALAKRFCSDPTVAGLLLTTRVGGLGLNLSAAATCFFLEHDWNPMADLQAMDRAHRIGQVGTLTVYRLYAPGTVEARVLGVAATKAAVAHAIVNAENSDALALGTDRVLDLVGASGGSGGGSGAGRGGGGVLSGESADERALAAAARGRFQDHLSGAGSGSGGAVAASGSSEQAAPTGDDGADAQVEAQYFELSVDAFLAHNRPRD